MEFGSMDCPLPPTDSRKIGPNGKRNPSLH